MLLRSLLALLVLTVTAGGQTTKKTSTPSTSKKSTSKAATPAKQPTAIIHTTAGDLKCELFSEKAPMTVANFVGLSTGSKKWTDPTTRKVQLHHPLYDGVIFHRTIPEFMIQGGDPSGTGSGDIGYEFDNELLRDLLFDRPGRLAMANRGVNTNSSQFFITEVPREALNPCLDAGGCQRPWGQVPQGSGYTIFGQCDDAAVALVKEIARKPCEGGTLCTGTNSRPQDPVKIKHIEILNAGKAAPGKPSGKSRAQKKNATPSK
ncbi:MAG TPA: peptidylprolyl isomerase [Verrucomicrobiae bacterium]|jgi:peptidyl-prolyl cis-trans isomerase A (cyclophilin A)|nr:peptidylprolyl isomerase [Verrucomicrobiae bacterium]